MDRKTTLFENQPAPKQPFDRFPVPIGPSDMKLGMQIGDGIIAALAPKYKPKPRVGKCTIMEMDFEVTTDAIQVTLDLIDDQDNDHTDIILVDHKPFLQFLEDGFYLDRDGGSHEIVGGDYQDNTYTVTIGYAEYLQEYICKADIKEYLTTKGIVTYEWDKYAAA